MKVLVTKCGISKNDKPYAMGLVWSEKSKSWCQVSDGHGGFTNTFVPLSEEKLDEILDKVEEGYILDVTRSIDVR